MQVSQQGCAVSRELDTSDHGEGDAASTLSSIHEPGRSFAIWRRALPARLQRSLLAFAGGTDLAIDRVLLVDSEDAIDTLPELGTSDVAEFLREDVSMLLRHFVVLSEARHVRLVLGLKRTDACRKFHTDNVRLRLLTTYVGPGTEWVPNIAVNRAAVAHPVECPCDANREIVRDVEQVRRVRTGDVLLLRGERYRGAPAAVHRSPPIEALGITRLVLTLSTVSS